MKKTVLLILVLFVSIKSSAFEYTYNGHTLSYSIRNSFPVKTCEVSINRGLNGNLTIPSIAIYNGEEYPVTSICEGAFSEWNSGLESVVIPNSIGRIGSKSFSNCRGLKNFIIADGNETVYFGANVFSGDEEMTQLYIGRTISLIEGTNATSGPFYNMKTLKQITIGDSVTSIASYAFFGTGLTSVKIPNSVTKIESNAFSNCIHLTEFSIADGETIIEFGTKVFYNCNIMRKLYVGRDFSYRISDITYASSPFYCMGSLKELSIGNSVTTIGEGAFVGTGITSVIIPNSVTTIGEAAFQNCQSLTYVIIPKSVTAIGSVTFSGCTSLTKAEFESIESLCNIHFNGSNSNPLSIAHNLWIAGKEIKDLIISSTVTSIGNYAFYGCSGLTSVKIPNSVETIGGYAFNGCNGLAKLEIPNSVTNIGNGSFGSCTSLTEFIVEEDNKNYSSADGVLFNKDVSTLIAYPGGKEGKLIIPESVTTIGWYAFNGCTNLRSIEIPNFVQKIDPYAFSKCDSICEVYYNTQAPINSSKSIFSDIVYKSATLWVPKECIEECKLISPWSNFNSIQSYEFPEKPTILIQSITLDPATWSGNPGESFQVAAFVYPSDATNKTLEWISTNEDIATVDKEGTVIALKTGECEITAMSTDGSGLSAICKVNVVPIPVERIKIVYDEPTVLEIGQKVKVAAEIMPETATDKSVTWSVGDSHILSINQNGDVEAVGTGTSWVRAEVGNKCFDTLEFYVEPNIDDSISFSIDGQILEQESTISIKSGETVLIDVNFYLKPTNPRYDNPTLNFSSDIIGVTELSQEPLDNSISGYKRRYAVKGLNYGESAFVFFAYNTAGRIWINVTDNSGIDLPEVDESLVRPIYYDLQGNRISGINLLPGIYIKKTGPTIEKVFIR